MFGTLAKHKIQPCNLPMIHAVALGEQVGSHACRCTTSMCGPVGGRVMRTHRDPKLLRDGSDINSQCNALVWLALSGGRMWTLRYLNKHPTIPRVHMQECGVPNAGI